MHRRNLILRRFGQLSFGLGYVEDGVWIDHAAALAAGEDLLVDATASERAALDAIHTWFDCCGEPVVAIATADNAPVASSVRT